MSGHGPGDARKGQDTGDGRRKRPSRDGVFLAAGTAAGGATSESAVPGRAMTGGIRLSVPRGSAWLR